MADQYAEETHSEPVGIVKGDGGIVRKKAWRPSLVHQNPTDAKEGLHAEIFAMEGDNGK